VGGLGGGSIGCPVTLLIKTGRPKEEERKRKGWKHGPKTADALETAAGHPETEAGVELKGRGKKGGKKRGKKQREV